MHRRIVEGALHQMVNRKDGPGMEFKACHDTAMFLVNCFEFSTDAEVL